MRLVSLTGPVALAAMFLQAPLAAQNRPAGWEVRFDRAGTPDSAVTFVTMEPGWHITTGPAGIYYSPSNVATGAYRVESSIHLFDTKGRDREALGIFIGGNNLDGDSQGYTYFMIRNDGKFLVKARSGSDTRTIVDWTGYEGINVHPGGDGSVENTLGIHVMDDGVAFFINGEEMASFPMGAMRTDGVVGIRVNHSLNIHVGSLTIDDSR